MYDIFGLFATPVSSYPDELDRDLAHERLGKWNAKGNDWRWQWASLSKMHYSGCPLYAPLTNIPAQPEKGKARIIEVKPNFHGVRVDFNALLDRVKTRFKRKG